MAAPPSYVELAQQRYQGDCPFFFAPEMVKSTELPENGRMILIDSLVAEELNYCLALFPETTVAEVAAAYLTFLRGLDKDCRLTNVHFSVAPFEYLSVGRPDQRIAAMQRQVIFPVWQRRRHLWITDVLPELPSIVRCVVCELFMESADPEKYIRICTATGSAVVCLGCAVTDEWLDRQACRSCGLRNRPGPKAFAHNAIALCCEDCSQEHCLKCGQTSATSLPLCQKCGRAPYCGKSCQKEDWPRHKEECRPPGTPWTEQKASAPALEGTPALFSSAESQPPAGPLYPLPYKEEWGRAQTAEKEPEKGPNHAPAPPQEQASS